MRLLNTDTLQLETFMSDDKPKYAILSHTWGDEEILFEDVVKGPHHLLASTKKALRKVKKSAKIAKKNDLAYIWIDTCCIDKSSSAELSEAINSMFNWYRDAEVCYAFLADYYSDADRGVYGASPEQTLSYARWFTRGWTLQELIAPKTINFYDAAWTMFGTRLQLADSIAAITLIDKLVLTRSDSYHKNISITKALEECSISKKMSWASKRTTTRIEDMAYCLLGIFGINMPLLYGEGPKAFERLQEHISAASHDQTLLCWHEKLGYHQEGVFAPEPAAFAQSGKYRPVPRIAEQFFMSNSGIGLEMDVYLAKCDVLPDRYEGRQHFVAVLSCSDENDDFTCAGVLLQKSNLTPNSYVKAHLDLPNFYGPTPVSYNASEAKLPVVAEHLDENEEFIGRKAARIRFDSTNFAKTKILLHDKRSVGSSLFTLDLPRAIYSYDRNMPFQLERAAPGDGKLSQATWKFLPAMIPGPGTEFIYGAANFRGPFGDGFFLIWGFVPHTDDNIVNPYTDRDWWLSSTVGYYFEVFRSDSRLQVADPSLDDASWVRKLIHLAVTGEADQSRSQYTKLGNGSVQRRWMSTNGDITTVSASLRVVEFLGRHKCEVSVNADSK